MSWAETKAAINSTVGTPDFEPLDKIIKGTWRLVASDSFVYASETARVSGSGGTYTLANSFKANAFGSASFAVTASLEQNTTYKLNILKNGTVAATNSRAGTGTQLVFLNTVSFAPGDLITFTFTRVSGSAPISVSQIDVRAYPMYAPILIESV